MIYLSLINSRRLNISNLHIVYYNRTCVSKHIKHHFPELSRTTSNISVIRYYFQLQNVSVFFIKANNLLL